MQKIREKEDKIKQRRNCILIDNRVYYKNSIYRRLESN